MTEPNFFDFKSGRRARRIDSTKPFKVELSFTREQLRQMAAGDCVICLGRGVVEGVEPQPCTCCWRER